MTLTDYLLYRKIQRGMVAYERNTGKPHPLSSGIGMLSTGKRESGSGSVLLTNYYNDLWYGTISIGTPAKDFTGVNLFFPI